MAPPKIVLLACGAYNPPTIMHFRMFEVARDYLEKNGYCSVVGGVLSPVHDNYGKKDLIAAKHRVNMLQLGVADQNWLRVSTWECLQNDWSRTRTVLQYHQAELNKCINDTINSPTKRQCLELPPWVPGEMLSLAEETTVKLLCGADLLESFAIPGLWKEEDIETIVGEYGLVVVTREGSNPNKFIYESDLLSKYQANIIIVTEWITNEVSSTKIRRALRRSLSIKYLVPEEIISYITKHQLYNTSQVA